MPVRTEASTRFVDEVRMIPPVAWVLAGVACLLMLSAMAFITVADPHAPPPFFLFPVGVLAGCFLGCYVLLIGYVNRDAGRRGMSRTLWTLIAIFIPNALGVVLYFVLRKPLVLHCPQCGAAVERSYGFCPRCRRALGAVCPHCGRGVTPGDRYCPYCGTELGSLAAEPQPLPDSR